MGIKKPQQRKISAKSVISRGGHCDQFPAISFRYLTTNKKYNFEYHKDQKELSEMMLSLSERIVELTTQSYSYWLGLNKYKGCEILDFWQFNSMKPKGIELSNDEKVYVFRFNQQNYRLCGVRVDKCPTLYIIGMDFNYSAYNH